MIIAMSRGATATGTAADTATPAVPDLPPEQAFVDSSVQAAVPATDAPAAEASAADGAPPVEEAARSTDGPRTGAAASEAERVRETRRQWAAEAAREAAAARDAAASRSAGATASAREADEGEPVERAVRVGGAIRAPVKIRDVRPVYPQIALQARVEGVVIVEARIGTDGRVSRTRVLRSIPLLDHAAVEAVSQWEYEPTLLNGVAVPVIMTVTVNFALR
jgi:protein TonB